MKPQISQIWSRFRACYRTQDALWKLGRLEAWRLGRCGAPPHAPAGKDIPCARGRACGASQAAVAMWTGFNLRGSSKLPTF